MQKLFYIGLMLLFFSCVLPAIFIKLKKTIRRLSLLFSVAGLLLIAYLSLPIIISNTDISIGLTGVMDSIKYDFFIDRLAAFFMLTITIVSLSVIIYSWSYIEQLHGEFRKNLLISFMNVFIVSMILVVSAANTIVFLFFWEIMAIASFFLVYHYYDKEETRKAGLFYFIMTSLSTLFLIIAFILLSNSTGSFSIAKASNITPFLAGVIFISLFLGFGIKSGIVPFHKWLPYAHPAAPSNISALMSGLMIKVAIYGLIRFVVFVIPSSSYALWFGLTILIAGTISAIIGVIYALKEHDIKRLLAYHSIENIGIILIGFGLYLIFSINNLPQLAALSLGGALLHTLNHALFKSLLFLTSGSVVHAVDTKNIEEMGGLIKTMPVTALLFLIGAVSISALPPFNGFVSEFMIFQAFFGGYLIENHLIQIVLVVSVSILALTSALAAACFVKAFGIIFLGVPRTEHAKHSKEAPWPMLIGPSLLAILCVVVGLFSFQFAQGLGYTFDIPNMLYLGLFLMGAYILVMLGLYRSKKIRVYETWGCGYELNGGKTQYTASGFSQPIISIFSPIFRSEMHVEKKFIDANHTKVHSGHVEMKLMRFFEEYLYTPLVRLVDAGSRFILKFHERDVDSYIEYTFIACLIIIIVVGVLK